MIIEGIEMKRWDECSAPEGWVMGRRNGFVKDGQIFVRTDLLTPDSGHHVCNGRCTTAVEA